MEICIIKVDLPAVEGDAAILDADDFPHLVLEAPAGLSERHRTRAERRAGGGNGSGLGSKEGYD